jgi:flagellar FliL protein
MAKIRSILSIVLKAAIVLTLLTGNLLSLAVAYIVFAPDDFPKPFYLSYTYPGQGSTVMPVMEENPTTPPPTPTPQILPGQGVMIDTGAKIINLADPGGRRYIRINVVLEFRPEIATTEASTKAKGEGQAVDPNQALKDDVNQKMPLINDVIITLISTKTFENLYTAEGKEQLRQDIMNGINARLPEHQVIAVYFSEFVVE